MPNLQIRTYSDIARFDPRYEPIRRGLYVPGWSGTVLDVLCDHRVNNIDALRLALREDWTPTSVLREFACRCAKRALGRIPSPDPRSVKAVATMQAWLRDEVDIASLTAAQDAAKCAVDDMEYVFKLAGREEAPWETRAGQAFWAAMAAWHACWTVAIEFAVWTTAISAIRSAAKAESVGRAAEERWQRDELITLLKAFEAQP